MKNEIYILMIDSEKLNKDENPYVFEFFYPSHDFTLKKGNSLF